MTSYEPITRIRTSEEPEVFIIYSGGSPQDITGAAVTLTVNDAADGSGTDHFTITGTLTDAVNGEATFTPLTANAALAADTYYYDVKMVLAGVPTYPVRGTWVVLGEIT